MGMGLMGVDLRCVSHGRVPRGVYLISVYLISVHLLGVHLMGVRYLEAFRCFNLAFWEKSLHLTVDGSHGVFALPTVHHVPLQACISEKAAKP
jgi:hypothetical protein